MKISKMKKGEVTKDDKGAAQNVNKPDYVIPKQTMDSIKTQVQDNKSIMSISNNKFHQASKFIADRQKYIIIELEIHKMMVQMKLQNLYKQVHILKNIPNNPIPLQFFQNQQRITSEQERSIYERLCAIQYFRTKQAQDQYQTAHANYLLLCFENHYSEIIQQKTHLTEQLQKTYKLIEKEGKQTLALQQQSKQVYEEKKKQNNLLQQMKGNIRVYCRLRPSHNQRIQYEITDNLIRLKRDKTELKSKNRVEEYEYLFEKIFGEDTPQDLVFQQLSQLVQCSVDGKNVCIFAYGQTGSGKTHTMTGSLEGHKQQMRGFIPRSIEYIFDQVEIAKINGYEVNISVSICEVYNDKIFDLLSYSSQRGGSSDSKRNISEPKYSKPVAGSGSKKNLHYEKSIQELVQFIVKTPQQALLAMSNALKRRTTAQTKMNTQSSRSHLIFEIRNEFYNPNTKITRQSSLVLVDLAGSERQKDSGVTGIRLQEAKSINNSLTQLGKVMRAIKDGDKPSFRNCKLTMILQKYLESDSKAVMFVNVSPDKKDLDQTVNSLVFAQSVRQCKLKNNKNLKSTSSF